MTLRVLDLFSGIGGFSLGLERTGGFRTVAFCEIEPFPRKVLAKHWPDVPIYEDVRMLTHDQLRDDGITVDVICGGFPCQDISLAGKGAGLAGERSGLWSQFARLIGELRPRYAIVENVAALLGRGLADVLGDLAALGYDAEWHCIPASYAGAPHRRDRLWIVANAQGGGPRRRRQRSEATPIHGGQNVANDDRGLCGAPGKDKAQAWAADFVGARSEQGRIEPWPTEPAVGRVAHGVSARVDRLRGLGNAVVPQIPEMIGHAILAREAA